MLQLYHGTTAWCRRAGDEVKEVTRGDRTIRYRESGQGAPLLLIHAFPLSSAMWEPQLAAPPAGWRLIAPDLRGFGDPPPGRQADVRSIDDYASDIKALLDELGIDRAVMGGLSLGGYVLFALMRLAPHVFRGAILADTRPQADTDEGREGRRRMQMTAEREGAAAIAREMVPKLLGEDTQRLQPEIARRLQVLIEANQPAGIVGALEAMKTRPDSTALLADIRFPTLVLVGEQDRLTPPALSDDMHKRISGSRLVVIPGAGHLPSLEKPAEFNAHVETFLHEWPR
jgi:pimeloyl-ACP methyl ester carboxylesterase